MIFTEKKALKKPRKSWTTWAVPELAANLFRATQTEEKLRREDVKGKDAANRTHHEVGEKVRQTIQELGRTMPEELPVVESIKKIETEKRKQLAIPGCLPKRKASKRLWRCIKASRNLLTPSSTLAFAGFPPMRRCGKPVWKNSCPRLSPSSG